MDRLAQQPYSKRQPPLPSHLAVEALRASASVGDYITLRDILGVSTAPTLRRLVLELLLTEGEFNWRAAEQATPPIGRTAP